MSKKELTVVFSSRKNGEENGSFIDHIKKTCGKDAHIVHIHNPSGVSISRIYHDMVESEAVESDVVVFIHDDIEFLKNGWGNEVLRLFNENEDYGVIGVAGSAQFDENGAWWNYEKKYGQVLHRSEGKSWLTAFSGLLDKDLEEVAVIDGLFMAIHKKRISQNFDNELDGFDMYDIMFCLSNFIDGNTKIGVTTNIRLAHNSIGKLKDSWYSNLKIVNERFGSYYPIEIKKGKRK